MVVSLFVAGSRCCWTTRSPSQRDNGDIDIGAGVELLFAELLRSSRPAW
jgi:hypothetical protein